MQKIKLLSNELYYTNEIIKIFTTVIKNAKRNRINNQKQVQRITAIIAFM